MSRNEGKVIKGTITGFQFNIMCGTTAMPIMAVDIAPDTSDSGISIDADDGGNVLFIAGSNTIKPVG